MLQRGFLDFETATETKGRRRRHFVCFVKVVAICIGEQKEKG